MLNTKSWFKCKQNQEDGKTVNHLSHGKDQLVLTKGRRSYWTRSASRLCWNEPAWKDTSAHAACSPPPPRILFNSKLTAETGSEWAGNVFKHFPVFTSHILTLSSNWRKEKQTLIVLGLPQWQACFGAGPTSAFHSSMRLTPTLTDPDTMRLDWGLKLQQKT